jgi:Rrf2 family protein
MRMRMSEGVEWAAHACGVLAALPAGRAMPGAKLAEYLGVPPAYLAKHMQALSRAEIVVTGRGPAGGYRLARAPGAITLADIAAAIEGKEPAFRCQEVRRRGPVGASAASCVRPCPIARSFWAAEKAWRAALAEITLVEVVQDAARGFDAGRVRAFATWLDDAAR